ncbi:MAG: aldo/keto reductase [Clostridia bacterium]|nr:aldo/keto reductase [Clostridia bacterium]
MNENMLYRRGAGEDTLSILGYGCMRFTKKGTGIDLDKAEREVMRAIRGGVNYLDTAYIYPGSEAAVGKILERNHCRDQVYIATKLPQYLIKSAAGIEKTFQEELSRLRTDHIDYYLMHMITDIAQWEKLEKLGIRDWIAAKKAAGQIRHIGFSYHGSTDMFLKVLNAYDWEFCQIQYNYMDEHSQAGRRGLTAAHEKGIPVIIMEPLRGGRLANKLPKSALDLIARNPRGYTAPEWSLRWLWDQEAVTCVLSGMNSIEMIDENLKSAATAHAGSFTDADFAFIRDLKAEISAKTRVGCTGCSYCMPCPHGVDIPGTFRCLNEIDIDGRFTALKEYYQTTAIRKKSACASMCVGCGRCERHCPQQLPIRDLLRQAAKELEPPIYKIARKIVSLWHPW